ncbi:MAG: phosphohistidine phosphatase SixA [Rhodothermales bacterium]|jgi:phosphohistidine phosphatase SixA
MKHFFLTATCIVLFACANQVVEPQTQSDQFQLILIRHAEKATGTDPGLTEMGQQRAEFIARWLGSSTLDSIWSSDYRRTRDTAAPLAQKLELDISYYDPRKLQELSQNLILAHDNTLVIGHSNTTPQLAAILCECEVDAMDETQYELAYLIRRTNDQTELITIDFTKEWQDRPAVP